MSETNIVFSFWLTSFNILSSSSIHVTSKDRIVFLLGQMFLCIQIPHLFFYYFPLFSLWTLWISATVNMHKHAETNISLQHWCHFLWIDNLEWLGWVTGTSSDLKSGHTISYNGYGNYFAPTEQKHSPLHTLLELATFCLLKITSNWNQF